MEKINHVQRRFSNQLKSVLSSINKSNQLRVLLLGFFIIFLIFYTNSFHESYPDEFDNILGGKYITQGTLPYSGFFSHHGPVSYFVAAIVHIFSGASFVKFRIIYSIFLFLFSLGVYIYLRKRFNNLRTFFVPMYILFVALAGTYMWSHMLLADSLAAFLLVPPIAVLLLSSFYKQNLIKSDILVISILTALAVLTSLTYIYLAMFIYLFALYEVVKVYKMRVFNQKFLNILFIFSVPYLLVIFYLLITGSMFDYYHQAIEFNQKYYIYNYPKTNNSDFINPLRLGIVIAYAFFINFTTLLMQVKDLNLGFPLNITLALGNTVLFIYLITKRKWDYAVFLICILIFSNTRSNPLTSRETDYQSAVYMMVSFLNISFVLPRLYTDINNGESSVKKMTYNILFFTLSLYTVFTSIFITNRFFSKAYEKYMGTAPLIYDRPQIAPIMNVANSNGYTWIGPFEYEELLYATKKTPTRYHVLLPGMGKSLEMQQEMISELDKNKPDTIWFNKNFHILGSRSGDYGKFFTEYLNKHYINLYDYSKNGIKFSSIMQINEKVDIETMLYIRKDKLDVVIKRLLQNNYIKQDSLDQL